MTQRLFCGFLLLIAATQLVAQNRVILRPSGFTPVSTAAISAADAALATASANSTYDVEMAFMTSFTGVGDRFEEYEGFGEDYMAFFQSAYAPSFDNPSDIAQEHQRLLSNAVSELGGGSARSVIVVYTTVMNLLPDRTDYDQKRFVLYGDGLSECERRRFEQIDDFTSRPAEFCVVSTEADNDAFVNWYAGKLADATDPNYIVTGTILFQGNVYCEPTELYLNVQHEEVLTTASDFHPPIELLVHPSMDVGGVNWSASSSLDLFTSLIEASTTLNFGPQAFEQFNDLVATWGNGQQSSLSLLPVNFQVGVDEDLLTQQANQLQNITFYYQNNHTQFPSNADITITLEGSTNFPGAPNLTLVDPGTNGNALVWKPDEDACEENSVISTLLGNGQGLNSVNAENTVRVLCPFIMEDLMVRVPYTEHSKVDPVQDPPTRRSANDGETLFIVANEESDLEDFIRSVNAEIIWEDERPNPDQYWINDPEDPVDDEPTWHSSPNGVDDHLTQFIKEDQWELDHAQNFPAAPPLVPPPAITTVFSLPTKSFDLTVDAFDQDKSVTLEFVRRNEFSYGNSIVNDQIGDIIEKVVKIKDYIKDKIGTNQPGQWPLAPVVDIDTDLKVWNEEDAASRFYFNKKEASGSLALGVKLGSQGDDQPKSYLPLLLPPPIGPTYRSFLGGAVEVGFGLRGKFTVNLSAELLAKKYNYEPLTSLEFGPPTISSGIDVELKIGAFFEANAEVGDVTIIGFSTTGELGPQISADLVWEWDEDLEEYDFYVEGELSPLQGDITATLEVLGYDLIDFSLMDLLELDGAIGPYPFEWFKDE